MEPGKKNETWLCFVGMLIKSFTKRKLGVEQKEKKSARPPIREHNFLHHIFKFDEVEKAIH